MEVSKSTTPRVFISYSHDSLEHEDRVLSLADRLRTDGVDALIDQYAPAPPEGWPMWMQDQIREADFVMLLCTETYLRRVERREEPSKGRGVLWEAKLIFNLLYPEDSNVQRFIPVLLSDAQPSSIPLPLRGLTHYCVDTMEGYENLYRHLTGQPLRLKPALGTLKALPAKEPSSYPSSLAGKPTSKTSASFHQRHRQQLIKQVRLDWIDGVLDESLYKVARIELGLVEHPLNTTIRIPEREPRAVSPAIPISQIFEEQASALLILGGPGTGKTTLLLELARDLLLLAEHDENQPIPAVFNLSSWAVRRQPLREWLIAELNERSNVPKRIATGWVEGEQILPLLDGLDEVATEHRGACVEAINNFRREYGLLPIAVCSRIADYGALGTKLRLRHAIEVQPLTRSQVEDYLERVGEPLRALRTEAEGDPSFWELLETPLMLWVAMLSYQSVPHTVIQNLSLEERRHQLFGYFIEAMFHRRERKMRYSADQSIRWLSSLACTLARNSQTVFYLESLDYKWLPTWALQWLARGGLIVASGVASALSGVLIVGLLLRLLNALFYRLRANMSYALSLGGLIFQPRALIFALIFGLIVGLIFGLIGAVLKLQPVEKAQFRWTDVSSRKIVALRDGLIIGLIFGLIVALIIGLIVGPSVAPSVGGLIDNLIGGLIFGLIVGLIFGLTGGLTRLFTSEAIPDTRSAVNEGTHRSIRVALVSVLIFGLIGWLIVGLILGLMEGEKQIGDLGSARLGVLTFGLIGGLICGGLFALKHFVLRLFLWARRSAPLRYGAFLAQARDLLFLRQVGGGYIFVHRILRDYFASRVDSEKTTTS